MVSAIVVLDFIWMARTIGTSHGSLATHGREAEEGFWLPAWCLGQYTCFFRTACCASPWEAVISFICFLWTIVTSNRFSLLLLSRLCCNLLPDLCKTLTYSYLHIAKLYHFCYAVLLDTTTRACHPSLILAVEIASSGMFLPHKLSQSIIVFLLLCFYPWLACSMTFYFTAPGHGSVKWTKEVVEVTVQWIWIWSEVAWRDM